MRHFGAMNSVMTRCFSVAACRSNYLPLIASLSRSPSFQLTGTFGTLPKRVARASFRFAITSERPLDADRPLIEFSVVRRDFDLASQRSVTANLVVVFFARNIVLS
jgi:hypothetical protein